MRTNKSERLLCRIGGAYPFLEATILSAERGDFGSCFNLLSLFCRVVDRTDAIPPALLSYVVQVLETAYRGSRLDRENRYIRRKKLITQYAYGNSLEEAYRQLAGGDNPGIFRRRQIHYDKAGGALAEFIKEVKAKRSPTHQQMIAAHQAVKQLRRQIIRGTARGREIRKVFALESWAAWNRKTELHREIVEDIEARSAGKSVSAAARQVAKATGLSFEVVRKIWNRRPDRPKYTGAHK